MTAAQKIAKEKFKKAIAYRQKTGVSLKEAFAHVYGKKVVKKKAAKKVVRKKAAKKVGVIKRKVVRKKIAKRKKISENGILKRIHIVKHDVERLDEAQHKHMSSLGIVGSKLYNSLSDLKIKHKKENGHWFDRQTMKYFNTKVESALIGGKYFIYSNKMPLKDRTYQIAEAYPSGNIFPVENSPHFKDKIQAKKYLLKIVKH